jgi:tRNA threonylcarbamoyl adenosine modification protein YjeE
VQLNESELVRWGEHIGRTVETPVFLALRGELGAGKSVLARAIARGAGVDSPLPSPTFNLLFRYRSARGTDIVHLDLFRLDDPAEVWELGWRELASGDEIVMVEWPERAEALLPPDRWDVTLRDPSPGSAIREVSARRQGDAPALPRPSRLRLKVESRRPHPPGPG